VHVGEKVVELLIVHRGAGHRAVAVKDDCCQTIVGGRCSWRHCFDLGDGL